MSSELLTDAEVGERLGIDRTTVYRWRKFSPLFQAELNHQRAEQSRLIGYKIRAAAFNALDTIIELAKSGDGSTRLKAALAPPKKLRSIRDVLYPKRVLLRRITVNK